MFVHDRRHERDAGARRELDVLGCPKLVGAELVGASHPLALDEQASNDSVGIAFNASGDGETSRPRG